MKKILCILLSLLLLVAVTGCGSNYAQINLKEPIEIPENGIIEKELLDRIKSQNEIAAFTGTSGDLSYEWTVFGSDLDQTKDINFNVKLQKQEKAVKVAFEQKEAFGFPALLSIYLNEKWESETVKAFQQNIPVYTVSITGSKTSILNLSVNEIYGDCVIHSISNVAESEEETSEVETEKVTSAADEEEETSSEVTEQTALETSSAVNSKEDTTSSQKDTESLSETSSKESSEIISSIQSKEDNRDYSEGKDTEKDKYQTDPVPEGKPMPVEPEDQEVDKGQKYTCTFSIECTTILNNLGDLDPDKLDLIPSDGMILKPTVITFYDGESVYDVLQRVCKQYGIHMEASWTPVYNSAYIEGIHNLYEFDCGALSGWMYSVNGWFPNYGCSRYQLIDGEVVEWKYTCDLGNDVGRGFGS